MERYQEAIFGLVIKVEIKHVKEHELFFAKMGRRAKNPREKDICAMRARDYWQWGNALRYCLDRFREALKIDEANFGKVKKGQMAFLKNNKPSVKMYRKALKDFLKVHPTGGAS